MVIYLTIVAIFGKKQPAILELYSSEEVYMAE